MSIISFIKEAGEKLLGHQAGASASAASAPAQNNAALQATIRAPLGGSATERHRKCTVEWLRSAGAWSHEEFA
ncbi:MAG: hypothetical protein M3Y67_01455 [Pseudomonadota bacterium]|nr:hypothetical protein [Pseudomonadota bacterium]